MHILEITYSYPLYHKIVAFLHLSFSVIVQDCVASAEEWCKSFPGEQIRTHTSTQRCS